MIHDKYNMMQTTPFAQLHFSRTRKKKGGGDYYWFQPVSCNMGFYTWKWNIAFTEYEDFI